MNQHDNRLDQRTTWISGTGTRHRISSMPRAHAENAAAWLRENAVPLLCARELASGAEVTAARLAEVLADPHGQMRLTPLHQALAERAAAPSARPSTRSA